MSIWVVLIMVLNFAISWWNCYAVGRSWCEAKAMGGLARVMAWAGAVMAASGFSWVLLFLLAFAAGGFGFIPASYVRIAIEIGYVVLIPGILASCWLIMVGSWARAYREGGFVNYGVAAWNTYATVHNTLSAVNSLGEMLGDLGDVFGSEGSSSSDDKDAAALAFAVFIVVLALLGGILLAAGLIRKYSARTELPKITEEQRRQMEAPKAACR